MVLLKILEQYLDIRNTRSGANALFKTKRWYEKIPILLVNGFIIGPICVAFWASSWDILCEILYPDNEPLSLAVSWIIAHVILFMLYMSQDLLQESHNYLTNKFPHNTQWWKVYDPAFLLRLII